MKKHFLGEFYLKDSMNRSGSLWERAEEQIGMRWYKTWRNIPHFYSSYEKRATVLAYLSAIFVMTNDCEKCTRNERKHFKYERKGPPWFKIFLIIVIQQSC